MDPEIGRNMRSAFPTLTRLGLGLAFAWERAKPTMPSGGPVAAAFAAAAFVAVAGDQCEEYGSGMSWLMGVRVQGQGVGSIWWLRWNGSKPSCLALVGYMSSYGMSFEGLPGMF